jgi:FtsH-binding integral membrane protein
MAHDDLVQSAPLTGVSVDERVTAFLRAVYGWMCAGLAITAGTAWFVASSPALLNAIVANRAIFWILAIAQLGIVVALSARVDKMSASAASGLFIVYSALTGVTMSFVLLAYTGESVASTFSSPPRCSAGWRCTARSRAAAWPGWASSCSWASSAC